jgi:hypothetical protein
MLWIGRRLVSASNLLGNVGSWFIERANERLQKQAEKLAGLDHE